VNGRLDQRSWETSERERRSKIEITADEVAPSLRWATATISKNERRGPEGGSNNSNSSSGGGGRPAQSEAHGEYQYEEEPF
jgi:single-strand DNA-binding protein